jgi:hypothetical protein
MSNKLHHKTIHTHNAYIRREEEDEVIDPDEGRYKDELRIDVQEGVDSEFMDDAVERIERANSESKRIRVERF